MAILNMSGAYSIRRASLVSVLSGLLGYKWWGFILHVSPTRLLFGAHGDPTNDSWCSLLHAEIVLEHWIIRALQCARFLRFCRFVCRDISLLCASVLHLLVIRADGDVNDFWCCLLNSLDRVGIFNDPHATVSHSWLTTPFRSLSLLRHFCALQWWVTANGIPRFS